ncbi:MAG: sulfotransferase domain-containing protein [Leptospirales bacterium]
MSSNTTIEYPKKTREIYNHFFNSKHWDNFKPRDGDLIIVPWAKSGTTWVQQITAQLVFNGSEDYDLHAMSPWLECRPFPIEHILAGLEAQEHQRFIKCHLPVDALGLNPKLKYICIVRDGRDAIWSYYNHLNRMNDDLYGILNSNIEPDWPIVEKPRDGAHKFFNEWMENDAKTFTSYFDHIKSWWNVRHLPNVKVLHFNDLKKDLKGEILKIADFLGIEKDGLNIDTIVEHCTFDYMKSNANKLVLGGDESWQGGAHNFMNKGVNGQWKEALTPAEKENYEKIALERLGAECANWAATGEL